MFYNYFKRLILSKYPDTPEYSIKSLYNGFHEYLNIQTTEELLYYYKHKPKEELLNEIYYYTDRIYLPF